MSAAGRDAHPQATRRALASAWRRNGAIWLVLLAIVAGETIMAVLPLGPWGFRLDVAGSIVAALVVGILSMGLDRAPTLDRLAAAAGFLFVAVLLTLTACDLFTRV